MALLLAGAVYGIALALILWQAKRAGVQPYYQPPLGGSLRAACCPHRRTLSASTQRRSAQHPGPAPGIHSETVTFTAVVDRGP